MTEYAHIFDQADALAAHVAAADAHHRATADTTTGAPDSAHEAIRTWLAEPVGFGCPHLQPDAPQPTIGFLSVPGLVYCLRCASTVSGVLGAGPQRCDLCGAPDPEHGLTYRLGDAGHLVGKACGRCFPDPTGEAVE